MVIFSYLEDFERIKAERVCRRWNTLCRKSWNHYHSLNFARVKDNMGKKFNEKHLVDAIIAILVRGGRFLFDITANYKYQGETWIVKYVFNMVPKYCQNLNKLFITEGYIVGANYILERVFSSNVNLKYLIIPNVKINGACLSKLNLDMIEILNVLMVEDLNDKKERDLVRRTFSNLKNLRTLVLSADRQHIDLILDSLMSKSLSYIKITELLSSNGLYSSNAKEHFDFKKNVTTLNNLEQLHMHAVRLSIHNLKIISSKNLTDLFLLGFQIEDYHYFLNFIRSSVNLQKISLIYDSYDIIDDDFLNCVVECQQLSDITLTKCPNITDQGILNLVKLPLLRKLIIERSGVADQSKIYEKMKHVEYVKIEN